MWFLTDLARLERERAAVEALEEAASWLEGVNWRLDQGAIVMECDIGLATGDSYRLRTTFPEHYPSAPASVRPQDLTILSSHQYGRGGELCLEIGPDNWHWDSHTTADLLRSAHRLLGDEAVAVYFERRMAASSSSGQYSICTPTLWLRMSPVSRLTLKMAPTSVDLHSKLIHMKGVFASKVDARVDLFLPINRAGEQRSDRRGDIECNQTLASTRGRIDSRDQQADEAIAQYHPQVPVERRSGGGVSEAQEPEQTRRLR